MRADKLDDRHKHPYYKLFRDVIIVIYNGCKLHTRVQSAVCDCVVAPHV